MGVSCSCLNDYRNLQEEYIIGSGSYSFKKIVSNINVNITIIINDILYLYIIDFTSKGK